MLRALAVGVVLFGALASPAAHAAEKDDGFVLIVAGGAQGDAKSAVLTRLQQRLKGADPERTVVIFTGDYLEAELPAKGEDGRDEAVAALDAHVAAVKPFFERGGRVYFLPGHTDFAGGGTKAVKRLRKLLNEKLGADGEERDAMPESACGNTTLVELSDDVGLLLVNSQWWMQDAYRDPNFNDSCLVKNRKAFLGNITDTMRKYRSRRLVVAAHHPLRTYGERGGAFTAKAHGDPAPVAGTAWVLARKAGLVEQYQGYPVYEGWSQVLTNEAGRYGSFIFVAGHDESLQYVTVRDQTQIIAGTTANEARPVVAANEGDFSLAQAGWAELHLQPSGDGEARFFAKGAAEPVFTKALPSPRPLAEPPETEPLPLPESPVTASFSKRPVWRFPGVVRFFAGSFYAEAFQLQLPFEVLDLATYEGGLTPYKIGGGQQSNSIRAKDKDGRDFAIRSTTKDASRLLPWPINRVKLFERLMEHAFTATHPEAALSLAKLSRATGVLHLEPRLMYLPDQAALGGYRGFITDEVVILEERPKTLKSGKTPAEHFGGRDEKTKFEDYDELVEKILEKPWKHRVDQEAFVRARLLDMYVGDWDRHRGQWRFAGNRVPREAEGSAEGGAGPRSGPSAERPDDEDGEGDVIWQPIAMDRDQAFASYDGAALVFSRLMIPQARSTVPFDDDYASLRWLNFNARDVDALMLNRVSHDRWMELAQELKDSLTDEVLHEAMATWRPETYALDGARIEEALKARREKLLDVAEEAYRRLARRVDVIGSMENDRFELHFLDGGKVRIVVVRRENGKRYYERTLDPSETSEANLYALDGDDVLEVHGKPHRRIELRFVGGEGKDVARAVGEGTEAVDATDALSLYDRPKGMTIEPSLAATDERSDLAYLNQYEQRENHEPDYGSFMPGVMVNRDVGALIGGTYRHIVPGWKKKMGAQHTGSAFFSTATLGAALDYQVMLPKSLDLIDQTIDIALRSPLYTRNFYGLTNELRGLGTPIELWRVRQGIYEARYGISRGGSRGRVGMQVLGQIISTDRTQGRFIETAPEAQDWFGPRYFAGARLVAQVNTFDNPMLPRRGVALHASLEGRYDVAHGTTFSVSHRLAGAAAIPLDRNERFVIVSRVMGEGIFGDWPFYFAPTVGARELRAYNFQQFAGDFAFAHTTDLRIDVFRIETTVPGTIGVNLSADHGTVFGPHTTGSQYHVSFGGGVWWTLVDLIGVQLAYHRSLDGAERFSALVGPLFADTGF